MIYAGAHHDQDSREKEYYRSMCLFLLFTDFFLWRRFLDTMLVLKHLVQSHFDFTITCPKQFLHSMCAFLPCHVIYSFSVPR